MKDDEKLTLTAGDVLRAARGCPTAKETLEKLFPQVFEPKETNEEVTELAYMVSWCGPYVLIAVNDDNSVGPNSHWNHRGVINMYPDGTWKTGDDKSTELHIKDGKLWRRKSR
jgi:hypothetical protein